VISAIRFLWIWRGESGKNSRVSQTRWFKEALEVYYQMMEAPASRQDGLRDVYWTLVDNAATTGKFTRDELHTVILARSRKSRHCRVEGFSKEDAFEIAGRA
jgi:hypothetical protein